MLIFRRLIACFFIDSKGGVHLRIQPTAEVEFKLFLSVFFSIG